MTQPVKILNEIFFFKARRLVRQQQSSKNSYAMQIGIKVCVLLNLLQ